MRAAEELHQKGIRNVVISLGSRGAVYCGELGRCYVETPAITPLSTVGAGDSTVAGFLAAYTDKPDMIACMRTACAFGTACCLEPGTNPPTPEKIATIASQIKVVAC